VRAPAERNARTRSGLAGAALAAAGVLAIAAATLTPAAETARTPAFGCVICGPDGGLDALANVLLFVPLGAGLALRRWRPSRALAAVALTTLAVELLQLRLVTGARHQPG
jgi:hypothetical protein